jgi:hypothetical protein
MARNDGWSFLKRRTERHLHCAGRRLIDFERVLATCTAWL